jgi:hypothetical protein
MAIVQPHIARSEAQEIANQYNATLFYEPSQGFLGDALNGGLTHTLGAADPKSWGLVRGLAENLEAINSTRKHWDIFVMSGASCLFSQTLKAMSDDSFSAANGTIHLVGWQKTIEIENNISRISNGKFSVVYE